jgi:thiol-disulfide isomerase/thioredoxin
MQELNTDNLSEIVAANDLVFVQYSAGWCGNCRIMKPKFKRESTEHPNAEFVIVDAEKYPQSRQMAKVDNLPTFAVFQGGSLKNQVQTNKYEVLKEFIHEASNN